MSMVGRDRTLCRFTGHFAFCASLAATQATQTVIVSTGGVEQIVAREPRLRASQDALLVQCGRYRAAA